MTHDASSRPMHLWVVGILSLLWNAFGGFDYLATHLELQSYMSQFTEGQRAYIAAFPAWAVSAWAFGVWGAVAGSIGLLLRRAWSVWAFALSLAGLAVSTIYQYALTDARGIMGNVGVSMSIAIWTVAILLLWYSVRQKSRGVLR